MYPNLYYAFQDLFGIELPFLRIVNTFGFFVAISFLVAATLLSRELKRKTREGLMQYTEETIEVGRPASIADLLINFFAGFVLGYKLGGIIVGGSEALQDPPAYLMSGEGNLPIGLLLGGLLAFWKWWEKRKQQLPKPEKRAVRIWPYDRVGEFTLLALIFGILGAKLFDIFENWSDFLKHPAAYLLSPAGLTFYGGLICATIAIILYARKHKISIRHLADAIAPALMAAYAVGRIGCQVAGDGDWGIYNTAYTLDANQKIVAAQPGDFERTVAANTGYFARRWDDSASIQKANFPKPGALSFMPDWFFAYNYPRNVNEDGTPLRACNDDKYCMGLPQPVFPTPLYEVIMGGALFFLLWGLRKRLKPYGAVFCLYLIVNGLERFTIELIRVNNRMDFLGLRPTQAEVIAVGLILTGTGLWIYLSKKNSASPAKL
ncbi:prolipoprotein diacylglyceryl transferase [Flaviaesturariibacter amylovorans]|uniref:Diacylglyceryl transferase n=1 Tax=Flaviaesturariibacter amylovorans TaxID=1084520 RepID=A0ABP8GXI9_9BACT